jgi:hypothetical protein
MLTIQLKQNVSLVSGTALVFLFWASWINSAAAFVPCVFKIDTLNQGAGENTSGYCAALQAASIATSDEVLVKGQEVSLLKQAAQLAQEILTVQNLVIQTEMLIKDLEENPLQVIVPDANQLMANQQRINRLAQEIDKNSSSIGNNLIKDLRYPDSTGLGQGSKFQLWSKARATAAQESYEKVTGFMKDLNKENMAVSQAIKNISHANGKTATAKAAANAAGQQLGILQDIKESLLQLLSMNAVENGARLQTEMDAATINDLVIKNGLGDPVTYDGDIYKGPGDGSKGAF